MCTTISAFSLFKIFLLVFLFHVIFLQPWLIKSAITHLPLKYLSHHINSPSLKTKTLL